MKTYGDIALRIVCQNFPEGFQFSSQIKHFIIHTCFLADSIWLSSILSHLRVNKDNNVWPNGRTEYSRQGDIAFGCLPLIPIYTNQWPGCLFKKNNTRINSHVTNIMYIRKYVFIENQTEAIGNSILFSMNIQELLPPPSLPTNLLIYNE